MFKMLVLQRFYSISDEELEYQVADRVSFQRFLRISQCDPGLLDGLAFLRVWLLDVRTDLIWNELKRRNEPGAR